MAIKNWNLKECIATVSGFPISGFGDGDAFSVAKNSDHYAMQIGADGEAARSRLNDESGTVTITLQRGSDANGVMMGLLAADLISGAGVVPLSINDLNGAFQVVSADAFISRTPDVTAGRETGSVEWVFMCGNLSIIHGPSVTAGF